MATLGGDHHLDNSGHTYPLGDHINNALGLIETPIDSLLVTSIALVGYCFVDGGNLNPLSFERMT